MKEYDLRDFLTEKFNENSTEHQKIWEQVFKTNGKVKRAEKILWGVGGVILTLAFIASLQAPQAFANVLSLLKII